MADGIDQPLRERWGALAIEQQRDLFDSLFTLTVMPGRESATKYVITKK